MGKVCRHGKGWNIRQMRDLLGATQIMFDAPFAVVMVLMLHQSSVAINDSIVVDFMAAIRAPRQIYQIPSHAKRIDDPHSQHGVVIPYPTRMLPYFSGVYAIVGMSKSREIQLRAHMRYV